MTFRIVISTFGLLLLGVLTGCQPMATTTCEEIAVQIDSPPNYFLSPYFGQLRPRRVVIVVPQNRTGPLAEQDLFAREFATQLRSSGMVDAVVCDRNVTCDVNAIRQGRYDERQLVQLSQAYNADAVLYCDVVDMAPYPPLSTSISFAMVDARESIVLLALDGTWRMRDTYTASNYQRYAQSGRTSDTVSHHSNRQSPTSFLGFVADEVAQFIGTLK